MIDAVRVLKDLNYASARYIARYYLSGKSPQEVGRDLKGHPEVEITNSGVTSSRYTYRYVGNGSE